MGLADGRCPTFGRITDNGAWTAWFGHIIGGSNIVVGKMIRHGGGKFSTIPGAPSKFPIRPGTDSADPKQRRASLTALPSSLASRAGVEGTRQAGPA
jgi:hypothetical protein